MDQNASRRPESDIEGGRPKFATSTVVKLFVYVAILGFLIALLFPSIGSGPGSRRDTCGSNIKQIGFALHCYHSAYNAFPPPFTADSKGNPLHSWRTLILPYLGEIGLYNSIDLSKPWDDPVNAEAAKAVVPVYQCPSGPETANDTTYLGIVGPGCFFLPGQSRRMADILDGTSHTLMVIEVDSKHAVPWMSPRDADEQLVLSIGAQSKLRHPHGVYAVFVDGGVRYLSDDLPAADRRALMSIDGNDKAPTDPFF